MTCGVTIDLTVIGGDHVRVRCLRESGHPGAHDGTYTQEHRLTWPTDKQYAEIDARHEARDAAEVERAQAADRAERNARRMIAVILALTVITFIIVWQVYS